MVEVYLMTILKTLLCKLVDANRYRDQTSSFPETSRLQGPCTLSKLGAAGLHFLSRLELQFRWDINGVVVVGIIYYPTASVSWFFFSQNA